MTPIQLTENESNADHLRVPSESIAGNARHTASRWVPFSVPATQTYYWHIRWQRDEDESLREIAAGETVRFDSADSDDAARWLRESDDDEDE